MRKATRTGPSLPSRSCADAPQLDGQYVVFGRVEDGEDVLNEIASVPANARRQPLIPITIQGAELLPKADAEGRRISRRALYSAAMAYAQEGMRTELKALVSAILFGCMAMSVPGRGLSRRLHDAARLLVLLGGGFGIVVVLLPFGHRDATIGAALFVGLIVLFKILGGFERATVETSEETGRR